MAYCSGWLCWTFGRCGKVIRVHGSRLPTGWSQRSAELLRRFDLGAIRAQHEVSTVYFNYVAIPLIVVAALGATFVYFRQKSNPAAGWKGEVPEMTIFFWARPPEQSRGESLAFYKSERLGAIGTEPYSADLFVLGLMAIILSGRGRHSLGQTVATLLSGLAAFGIIVAFGEWPPSSARPTLVSMLVRMVSNRVTSSRRPLRYLLPCSALCNCGKTCKSIRLREALPRP